MVININCIIINLENVILNTPIMIISINALVNALHLSSSMIFFGMMPFSKNNPDGAIVLVSSNMAMSMSLQKDLCNGLNKDLLNLNIASFILLYVCSSLTATHPSTEDFIKFWVLITYLLHPVSAVYL